MVGKSYLDLGCGPNTTPDFINLDYEWNPGVDVCWDLAKGLPLPKESLNGIFTEHCLEHFPLDRVSMILRECWRVLKPQGTIRIVVPDGELYLTRYTDLTRGLIQEPLPYAETDRWHGLYTPIMSVNRIFLTSGHRFIFDFDAMRHILEKNGFTAIAKEQYMKGRDQRLLRDSQARAIESLYVEATKN